MKKFLISVLSILSIACLSAGFLSCGEKTGESSSTQSASQESTPVFETDEDSLAYTLSEDKSYYAVCGMGNYAGTEVVVPDSFRGLPVKEIAEEAFKETSLTKVTLPDTVTVIGKSAFDTCTSLQIADLGKSVTAVGELAFANCDALQKVVLSETLQTIADYAFMNCHKLQFFTLPATLKSIGKSAFFSAMIRELVLPESLETLGEGAFGSCASLKRVTLGGALRTIGAYAFARCKELTKVTIGDSITTVGGAAFSECDKLKTVNLGKAIASVEELAFKNCFQIQSVYYSGTVADWCAISFEDKYSNPLSISATDEFYIGDTLITGELVIPDTVTSIGAYAFYSFHPLTSVVIGEGVTSIGTWAFQDSSLESALFKVPTGWTVKIYGETVDFSDPETAADSLNNILKKQYSYTRGE